MKLLAFLIIIFGVFWFFFSPKPVVINDSVLNNDEYSNLNDDEPKRKKLADMDMRDLNNGVNSGLDKIDSTIDNITSKTKEAASPFLENENVRSFIEGFKIRWQNFKVWTSNLPIIKQYRKSIYSDENWRNEMDATDFADYTNKNSTGAKMLREGTKEWKKL
ncbi:hypothetical protein [Candidatus Ruminimicrobium bovinum]|uniref:hypothetical protein n=1 Tax=Candidatus Ruminimicrobium bovinum TaxID=3242779 RepID=UPI0039B93983